MAQFSFPKIYQTFQAKDLESNDLVEYIVRDLSKDRIEDALSHLLINFIPFEPECESLNLKEDDLALSDYLNQTRKYMEDESSLVCLKKGSDQIVALAVQHKMIRGKFPKIVNFQSKKMQDLKKLADYMSDKLNIYEFYMEDTILVCSSISVHEKYRGRGIGSQMLEAQKSFMKRMNLKVAAKYITSMSLQKAATKKDFRMDKEYFYKDLEKLDPIFSFPGIKSQSRRLMSLRLY